MGITITNGFRQATLGSLASGSAIALTFQRWFAQRVIARYDTDSWDELEIKEHGNMLWDPITSQWILIYSGESADGLDHVGAIVSADGSTWAAHPQNPISGATNAEDPYIAKTANGEVYRDSDGRALMFCEEKTSATEHRGINLFKSNVGSLDGWDLFGRVLDRGSAGAFDESVTSSPIVVQDGAQLVMLYEGIGTAVGGEAGSVGVATSDDEGETWVKSPSNPVIDRADVAWASSALGPGDVIKVGSTWVLLMQGSETIPDFFNTGRWATTDDPSAWDDTSWVEMTGNPFTHETNTLMCWKNDPQFAVSIDRSQQRLLVCAITPA